MDLLYKASDGAIFETTEACEAHERRLQYQAEIDVYLQQSEHHERAKPRVRRVVTDFMDWYLNMREQEAAQETDAEAA